MNKVKRANRPAPRPDQVRFRLLVSGVWLSIVVYMLVVMAFTG